ncbi:PqqD family protein [Sphingomonas faeni]|uniref:PqqD family protein n=1 Tax=Sphingomonas faeni TaxID=185950 RepID=UPI0033565A2C
MSDMWARNADWVGTEVEDSFVMIDLATGTYLALNRTASIVWKALETPQTREAIESQLIERFAVSVDDCTTAVGALLDQMRDLKIAHLV